MSILFLIIFAACMTARYTVWKEDQPWQWKWICKPLAVGTPLALLIIETAKNENLNFFSLLFSGWLLGLFIPAVAHYFGVASRNKNKDTNRRGVNILTEKDVTKMIKKAGHKTHARLGGLPVPVDIEPLHFLMAGAPGSGKSLAFYQMLTSARQREHRAIISDPGGEFLKRFYQDGDVIFNPFDQRGVDWSPLAEMRQPYDAARLAASMIPEGTGSAAEWNGYSRTVLEAVLESLFQRENPTNADLVYFLTISPLKDLADLVEGHAAQRFFAKLDSGMLASVMNIIISYIKPYSYLNPASGKNAFSIRKWVEDDGKDWLFLSFRDDQLQAIRPMIAAVLDIAASAVLSLPASRDRRIFFAIDEFASLGYVNSMEPLLTKGRKCGAVAMLGVQAISQPREIYGREKAQTLLSCLGTWLVLKQPDADTADYMSKFVGDEEIRRTVQSGSQQGGGWQEQISRQRAIIPSELQNLSPRIGILNIAGAIPPCWTTIPITQLPDQTEAFQDREMRTTRSVKPLPAEAAPAVLTQAATLEQEATAAANVQHGDDPFADLLK